MGGPTGEPGEQTHPTAARPAVEARERHARDDLREPLLSSGPGEAGEAQEPGTPGGAVRVPPTATSAGGAVPVPPPVMSVDDLAAFLTAAFPNVPRTYQVVEVTGTGVVLRLPVGVEHERPGGTVSGPTMMSLADAAAWLATLSRIGPVALSVTSSLTINFLRKPPLADLWARASLLKLGRRLSVSDVHLLSAASGELVAQATVTYAIPRTS